MAISIPNDIDSENVALRAQQEFESYKEQIAKFLADIAGDVDVFIDEEGTVILQHTDPKYDENVTLDTPAVKANLAVDTRLPTQFSSYQPGDESLAIYKRGEMEGYEAMEGKLLMAHIESLADKPLNSKTEVTLKKRISHQVYHFTDEIGCEGFVIYQDYARQGNYCYNIHGTIYSRSVLQSNFGCCESFTCCYSHHNCATMQFDCWRVAGNSMNCRNQKAYSYVQLQ